jgi:hypothetical protein
VVLIKFNFLIELKPIETKDIFLSSFFLKYKNYIKNSAFLRVYTILYIIKNRNKKIETKKKIDALIEHITYITIFNAPKSYLNKSLQLSMKLPNFTKQTINILKRKKIKLYSKIIVEQINNFLNQEIRINSINDNIYLKNLKIYKEGKKIKLNCNFDKKTKALSIVSQIIENPIVNEFKIFRIKGKPHVINTINSSFTDIQLEINYQIQARNCFV